MCLMKVGVSPVWKEEISQPSSTFEGPKAFDSGSPIQMAWQQTMIRVLIFFVSVMVNGKCCCWYR